MWKSGSVIMVLLIAVSAVPAQAQEFEFLYDGEVRSYVVYEPALGSNPQGYPLVIGLHGAGSGGAEFIATAGMVVKANKEKFLLACPNGLKRTAVTWWNAGGFYDELTDSTDDLGFISALIDTMTANYPVDSTRVYVMGFSNGSCMSYHLAHRLSRKVAAIGAVSGQMVYEDAVPEMPVPIIHFHGLSDTLMPFGGRFVGEKPIPAVDSILSSWREINGCSTADDTLYTDANGIVGRQWASQSGSSDMVLYTNPEGEHEWPRPANWGISATDIIWDFFSGHHRSGVRNITAGTIMHDGEKRSYIVYVPSGGGIRTGAHPLVIGLHCHTGTAAGLLSYTDLIQKAEDEGFIGVFPNGLKHPIGTAWNAGSSFEWMTGGTEDAGFISALIDEIIELYDVDTTRIYVVGHSNGAMMSYRLAAELSHRIAAIGCVAAPMVYEYCDPEYPVPLIHFHGLADTTCPYEGIVKPHITIPHVDTVLTLWRSINVCEETPLIVYDVNGTIGQRWRSPEGKHDVVLYTVADFMHGWPRMQTVNIAATDVIWSFLNEHQRLATTSVEGQPRDMQLPHTMRIESTAPNPFNTVTRITAYMPRAAHATLRVFDMLGQEVEVIEDRFLHKGYHVFEWMPGHLPNGSYLCVMLSGAMQNTRVLTLLR